MGTIPSMYVCTTLFMNFAMSQPLLIQFWKYFLVCISNISLFSVTLFDGNDILEDKYDEPKKLGLFQLQLRYDEGILVLNSIGPGSSSSELREDLKIQDKDEKLKIIIKVTQNKYKIYVNDDMVATFNHRVEPSQAKFINVYGEFYVKKLSHNKY